jgi:hypothetical protein
VTPSDEPAEKPPPEVAADPERLAVWRETQAAHPRKVFDVTGCDRYVRLACDVFPLRVSCLPAVEFDATSGRLIVDPAVSQKALEALQHATPAGPPRLGIAFASVRGLGLVVGAVLPGGVADGKLRADDVIVTAGGEPVTDAATLARIVQSHAGRPLDLNIRRDGRDLAVAVDVRG